jgi:hypothetical protein
MQNETVRLIIWDTVFSCQLFSKSETEKVHTNNDNMYSIHSLQNPEPATTS